MRDTACDFRGLNLLEDATDALSEFERALRPTQGDVDFEHARKQLRRFLWSNSPDGGNGSVAEALAKIDDLPGDFSNVAAVLLRSIAVDHLLPPAAGKIPLDRHLVSIVESHLSSLCEFIGLNPKAQTYEKLAVLQRAHGRICDLLQPLTYSYPTLEGLVAARQQILGALNHSVVKRYGKPFSINAVRSLFERLLHDSGAVLAASTTLLLDVEQCQQTINDGIDLEKSDRSFLYFDFLVPFFKAAQQALNRYIESARGRFAAHISFDQIDGSYLPKRYPLQEEGRLIQVRVPLKNTGPGIAIGVTASIDLGTPEVALQGSTILLGNVMPGPFSLVFDAMIISPISEFAAIVQIDWGQAGETSRSSAMFTFKASAQSADIAWADLEYHHPYSTEPAEGDSFVGRDETVRSLAGRMLRTPMEPFYITGQKRVGKTSLAYAAVAFAKSRPQGHLIKSTYVLWGHIANANPMISLNELGRKIENLIRNDIPDEALVEKCVFNGSLSPLIELLELARQKVPDHKFVVTIDEFDEIHQELFLSGNLAETFFANLRALSAARNFSLILVGGENMPFLMERQGDKLNKFTRHNLNYFDRDNEWIDYQKLIRHPTREIIVWHEDAISEIYNETNGNPFFTKLICSRLFNDAVRRRDADITSDEINIALNAEVDSLDVTSFAHLWHDGIAKPLAEREPDILRRRRVLVLLSRCSRKRLPLSVANLSENIGSTMLPVAELGPTLADFVRRGVLAEVDGSTYTFKLPIFERWLRERGLAIVQPDQLTEELASIVQAEDDAAFIRSEEIVSLVEKWPTYQGRHIGTDNVRAWYQQVDGFREQRILFKILQNLKFVGEDELRRKAASAFGQIRRQLSEFVKYKLTDRRKDVILTFVDGLGKSGDFYASHFAEENGIDVGSIVAAPDVATRIKNAHGEGRPVEAVIIIDDIAASGRSLSENLAEFLKTHGDTLRAHRTKVIVVAFYATREAVDRVLKTLEEFDGFQSDFRAVELISERQFAFSETSEIWDNEDQRQRAKALAVDIGTRIYRSQPLGYGGLGLLIVFPTTVPNNSLPILHSHSKNRAKPWRPLFIRPTN